MSFGKLLMMFILAVVILLILSIVAGVPITELLSAR